MSTKLDRIDRTSQGRSEATVLLDRSLDHARGVGGSISKSTKGGQCRGGRSYLRSTRRTPGETSASFISGLKMERIRLSHFAGSIPKIPKGDGKQRPISIPALEDKIVPAMSLWTSSRKP